MPIVLVARAAGWASGPAPLVPPVGTSPVRTSPVRTGPRAAVRSRPGGTP